jgi:hypothetical protein
MESFAPSNKPLFHRLTLRKTKTKAQFPKRRWECLLCTMFPLSARLLEFSRSKNHKHLLQRECRPPSS